MYIFIYFNQKQGQGWASGGRERARYARQQRIKNAICEKKKKNMENCVYTQKLMNVYRRNT